MTRSQETTGAVSSEEIRRAAPELRRSMTKAEYRWLVHFARKHRRYSKVYPFYVTATSWG